MLPHPNFGREALMRPRFCLIPIVLVMAVAARAEVVMLKNGDRLTGHWTSVVEAKLLFKSDVVGDVSIPIDQIRSFAPAETVVVLLPKGETVSGNLSVADGEKLEVRNASATRTFAAASVEAIYPEAIEGAGGSRKPWRNWRFNGNLGYSLLRGDRAANTASLGLDAVRRQPNLPGLKERWRTNFFRQRPDRGRARLYRRAHERQCRRRNLEAGLPFYRPQLRLRSGPDRARRSPEPRHPPDLWHWRRPRPG